MSRYSLRIGMSIFVVATIIAGVSLVLRTDRRIAAKHTVTSYGNALPSPNTQVVIDSDNVLLSPNTQAVVDGYHQRALVIDNISNALTLDFLNHGLVKWGSEAVLSGGHHSTGILINTRTHNYSKLRSVGKIVHLLAVDDQAGQFLAIDAINGQQAVTLIDPTRGMSQTVRFANSSLNPVFVASAVDMHHGRLLITTLLSTTANPAVQSSGVALFDTHSGRLLHLTKLPAQPLRFPHGLSIPPLGCSITIDTRTTHAFVFNSDGSISVLNDVTGRLINTYRLPTALRAAVVDVARGHAFAIPNLGTPYCAGLHAQQLGSPTAQAVTMLDTNTGMLLRTVPLPFTPTSLAVDPARKQIIVVGDLSSQVAFLNATTGSLVRTTTIKTPDLAIPSRTVLVDQRRHRVIIVSRGVFPTGLPQTTFNVLDERTGIIVGTRTIAGFVESVTVDEQTGYLNLLAIIIDRSLHHLLGQTQHSQQVAVFFPLKLYS